MAVLAFDPADLSAPLRRAYDALDEEQQRALAEKVTRDRGYVPDLVSIELLVALSYLTDEQRETWVDSEVCGLPLRAIAADHGVSHQTVSNRKRRATETLRQLLFGGVR